jgi:hypothetical protein
MKKLFFILFGAVLFASCTSDNNPLEKDKVREKVSNEILITNSNLIRSFNTNINYSSKEANNKKSYSVRELNSATRNLDLDTQNIYRIENQDFAYMKGKLNNNDVILFKAMEADSFSEKYLFCETRKISEDLFEINYYDEHLINITTIKLVPSKEQIIFDHVLKGANIPRISIRAMGQETMNCISDAYTNQGWISVWTTVQSAFIPQTAVMIAGLCALHNI